MQTLVYLFLVVIALSALLQAGVVVGMAVSLRRAEDDVDALAETWDEKILPHLQLLESLTASMATSTRGAVDGARRLELRISSFMDHVGRRVETASSGLADTFDDTSETVEAYIVPGIARSRGPFAQARAAWAALREGLALFRG